MLELWAVITFFLHFAIGFPQANLPKIEFFILTVSRPLEKSSNRFQWIFQLSKWTHWKFLKRTIDDCDRDNGWRDNQCNKFGYGATYNLTWKKWLITLLGGSITIQFGKIILSNSLYFEVSTTYITQFESRVSCKSKTNISI